MQFLRITLTSTLLCLPLSTGQAADSAAGLAFVSRWCGVCHAVERAPGGLGLALPFLAIAEQGERDRAWLRA
jgi:mono/diheme cytochrome c family protein